MENREEGNMTVLGSVAWMSLRYVDDSGTTYSYKVKQLID